MPFKVTNAKSAVKTSLQNGYRRFKGIFFAKNPSVRARGADVQSSTTSVIGSQQDGYQSISYAKNPCVRAIKAISIPESRELFNVAKKALDYARENLPGKAVNKEYDPIPKEKRSNYSSRFLEMRDDSYQKMSDTYSTMCQLFGTRLNPEVRARVIRSYGNKASGVCDSYACLVYEFLCDNLPSDVSHDMIILEHPGTHVFNVINPPKKNADGSYPQNFSAWPKNAIVVDAWAKIICPIEEFGKQWNDKMQKWDDRGLKINRDSPLSKQWFNAVSVCEKESWFNAQERIHPAPAVITINNPSFLLNTLEPPLDTLEPALD